MSKKRELTVQGNLIGMLKQDQGDYINLTDMVRSREGDPRDYIRNWLRTGTTIEVLGVWEKVYNSNNFNVVEFHHIKAAFTRNDFLMSVKKWVERTNAIGITSKSGRYGGTYAHSDIALHFATWLSPEFYIYLIKEFQRLKIKEAEERLGIREWNLKRTLSKINYSVHTDAIKETLIPPRLAQNSRIGIVYANEADILNVALFGMTARDWKSQNPKLKGNMRDHASTEQLLVLSNLEAINAELIRQKLAQDERLIRLNEAAITQMRSVLTSPSLGGLSPLDR
ncbi:MAG: KilA-N domain-containing protein [Bacteroidota bacterium]